uniref:cell growth-regulating nucleolar protein-like n=1 Tax=Styela clava TaxID=7725 RepID=UPI00193AD431|nr:cell growth-regulating nucleolar protein-like [Styela clava]
MVFYTCSGCGESLKKNKVEKHVYTCRGCEYLTCIDCSCDFYGDDYKNHTSCITEDQKYSAKGTEFKPNKGDVKQQKWLDNIDSILSDSNSNLSSKAKQLIENLKNYDNIPRKRPKFLNFLKNSLRMYDSKLGEEIWSAFSAANGKNDVKNCKWESNGDSREEEGVKINEVEKTAESAKNDSAIVNKKDKKKKKLKLDENVSNHPEKDEISAEKPKKKKTLKHKKELKDKNESSVNISLNEDNENAGKECENPRKIKKRKLDTTENSGKSKKKKKDIRNCKENNKIEKNEIQKTDENSGKDEIIMKSADNLVLNHEENATILKKKKKKSKKGRNGLKNADNGITDESLIKIDNSELKNVGVDSKIKKKHNKKKIKTEVD